MLAIPGRLELPTYDLGNGRSSLGPLLRTSGLWGRLGPPDATVKEVNAANADSGPAASLHVLSPRNAIVGAIIRTRIDKVWGCLGKLENSSEHRGLTRWR
jgi:hypothetical protein